MDQIPKRRGWGDIAEEEGVDCYEEKDDAKELLPVPHTEVDENGIKTQVIYKRGEDGAIYKTIRKTRNKLVRKKISLAAIQRRKLKKFGECKGVPRGPEKGITFESFDEIQFDFIGDEAGGELTEEDQQTKKLEMALSRIAEGAIKKPGDARSRLSAWNKKQRNSLGVTENSPAAEGVQNRSGGPGGRYVPPSQRSGGRSGSYDDDDEPTIRITNLTEEASYEDLRALVSSFRPLKVRLAKDRVTQRSRGFAFISFASRRSAQECMDRLNGHGYGHLILSVEWAKSFKSVQKGASSGGGRR